tara:strand:+ start:470 stop:826 length:357 start_codon:yes stop_codon:yes gene_type:complete
MEDTVAQLIVSGVLLYWCYCFCRGYNDPEKYAFKKDPDFFELGYIEREDPVVVYVEEPRTKKKPKAEKPKKHPLFDDCCSTLKSLGYKATQAKQVAKQVFDGNDITSIEQFIRIAAKA